MSEEEEWYKNNMIKCDECKLYYYKYFKDCPKCRGKEKGWNE